MIKRIHRELDKLEPTEYHEQYRPYNLLEAILIVFYLAVLYGSIIFVVLSLMFK